MITLAVVVVLSQCLVACVTPPKEGDVIAVQGYLDALITRSATQALSYACTAPSGPYLTDSFYQSTQQNVPIRVSSVSRDVANGGVAATYTVAGQGQTYHYDVIQSDGRWCLPNVAKQVKLDPHLTDILGPLSAPIFQAMFGGQPLDSLDVLLLPGVYNVTTPNPLVEWDGQQVTVLTPDEGSATSASVVSLAPGAGQIIGASAQEVVAACLNETTPVTSCGLSAASSVQISPGDPSTYVWSVSPQGTDFSTMTWYLDEGTGVAYPEQDYTFRLTYVEADWHLPAVATALERVGVTITDPDHLVVTVACPDRTPCDTI